MLGWLLGFDGIEAQLDVLTDHTARMAVAIDDMSDCLDVMLPSKQLACIADSMERIATTLERLEQRIPEKTPIPAWHP